MNQSEFAAHLGVTPSHITQMKNNGRIVMDGDQVDVEASMRLINDTADPSKASGDDWHAREKKNVSVSLTGTEAEEKSQSSSIDVMQGRIGSIYQKARAIEKQADAEMKVFALKKLKSEVLDTDVVMAAVADGDLIVCERIEAMLYALASQLEGVQGEQKRLNIMLEHWETIRGEISRSFYRMVKT